MASSNGEVKKIYLAGPDVFLNDTSVGLYKKSLCEEYGFEPLYPLDNEISGDNAATNIYQANCAMIDKADAERQNKRIINQRLPIF